MALPPAPPVPDLPIGVLGLVPEAPTPQAFLDMPEPPTPTATGVLEAQEPPVPEMVAPIDFLAEPPVPGEAAPPPPPVPAGVQRAEAVESAQATVEAGLGRLAEMQAEERALAEQFIAAKTPDERARIQEQAGLLRDASTVAQDLVSQAQEGVQARVAQAQAARNVELAEAQEASLREQQAEAAKVRQEADVRAKAREEALQSARAQMQTDRQAARALLERGPQATGVALTLSSMFQEAVRAAKAKEAPNFQAIFQRAWERDRQAFADEFDRAQGAMQLTGDEIADVAQREREDAARQATAIAAIAAQAEERMQLQAAQATTEEQRILASQVLPMLREERAQREAEAVAAREQAELKRRESEAGITQKMAQARKLEAETTIAERKAGRIGRGGARQASVEAQLRGLSKEDRKRIEDRGIRGSSGEYLRTPDGGFVLARDKEDAKKLATEWAGIQTVNDSLNQLDALRKEYGHEWDISNSEALQKMKSTMAELELRLKDVYQLGVLSDSDLEMLQNITGGDPTGWFDKRPTWANMRERAEMAFNRQLKSRTNFQGKFRLTQLVDAPEPAPDRLRAQISAPIAEGRGRSLESRKADVKTLRNALKADPDLSLEEADERYAATLDDAADRLGADVREAQSRLAELRAPEYATAQAELGRAIADNVRVNLRPGATGEEKRAAERAMRRAQANVRKLESEEERALSAKIDDHEELLEYVRQEAADARGKLGRARRDAERRAEEKVLFEEFTSGLIGK